MTYSQAENLNAELNKQKNMKVHLEDETQEVFENVPKSKWDNFPKHKSDIEKAVDRKNHNIEKSTQRKEDAIAFAAIHRDAAMFASSIKSREELKEDYEYWLTFFEKEWENNN